MLLEKFRPRALCTLFASVNYDAVAWRLSTCLLSTGNRHAARHHHHLSPISGNHDLGARRLNTFFLCIASGLAASHHYLHFVWHGTGCGRLNTTSRLTIGLAPKQVCFAGGQQSTHRFRAVTINEQGPAFIYSHMTYLSRTGSKGKYSMSKTEGTCWKCQKNVHMDVFFCLSCNAIQPPDPSKDYFQIMNSERTFMVNVRTLQEQYRNLQRLLHPDYFSQKSQKERDLAEKQSSLVNKAYRTLLTPLSRGLYLLKLNGIKLKEGTDSDAEMPFIVEIMEINEKLEDALEETEVQDIGNFIDAKYEELTEDVSKAFEKGDVQEAKLLLIRMQYFSNLQEKVKTKIMPL